MSGCREGAQDRAAPPWQGVLARGHVALALVRHGQTAWNAERRFLGVTDIPLDAVGEAQVEMLAERLGRPFARVYASPLARALRTAHAFDGAPTLVPDLTELGQGDLEGLRWSEAYARFPDFFAAWSADAGACCIPGGESLTGCRDRALAAVERIARAHRPGEVVAVVTHQMVIASVACTLAGERLAQWRAHGVGNATITVLAWDGERLSLEAHGGSGSALAGV